MISKMIDSAWLYFAIAIMVVIIGASIEYTRFQNTKKYYPKLTYIEYLFIQDKLRITPVNEKED